MLVENNEKIEIKKRIYRYKIIKYYVKVKGLILFIVFYYIPIILTYLIIYLLNLLNLKLNSVYFKGLLSDNLLLYSLYFFIFFIFFLFLVKRYKKVVNFFSKENWFISMGKAFIPAIIAFSSGFFVTFLIIKIFDFLPEVKFIKNWLNVPNEGFIILLDYIKNANTFKVITWFFYIIVVIPLIEEIYFRGFLQNFIQKIFKRYNLDIIFTALIFSLFHIFSLSNVIFAFIVGLFLSWQRKENNSINISIWIHGIINFAGLFSGIIYHYLNNRLN